MDKAKLSNSSLIAILSLFCITPKALAASASYSGSSTSAFNTNLGFLEGVQIVANPPNTITSTNGNHTHFVSPSSSFITTANNGYHNHFVDLPAFNVGPVVLNFPGTITSTNGNHTHSIIPNSSTTSAAGNHVHAIDIGTISSSFTPTTSYLGYAIDPPVFTTSTSGNHTHVFDSSGSTTSLSGNHQHIVDIPAFSGTTTFFYDSNEAPNADPGGAYILDLDSNDPLSLDATASNDPNAADSIVSFQWDLDNDGAIDFDNPNPNLILNQTQYSSFFPNVGNYDLSLKVTDSLGLQDTAVTSLQVTATSVPFEFSPTLGIFILGSFAGLSQLRKKLKSHNSS